MPRKPAKKRKTASKPPSSKSASKSKAPKSSKSKTASKKRTSSKSTQPETTQPKVSKTAKDKTTPSKKSTSAKTSPKKQDRSKTKKATETQTAKKGRANTSKPASTKGQNKPSKSKSAPSTQKSTAPRTAKTVKTAFKYFRAYTVDLPPVVTQKGRSSQTFLVKQIKKLAKLYSDFPRIKGNYIPFGSFSRNVKIYPLDDIDLLILLNGADITISQTFRRSSRIYTVTLKNPQSPLAPFADEQGQVNSTKILNRIKTYLPQIPHYQKPDTKKRMQSVTLKLKSHDWTFDIVPAIPVYGYGDRITHYLIPDGHGNWIATNPKIDAKNMATANKDQQGELLAVMRLLKYWNNRTHKPRLSSYYFETIVIHTFRHAAPMKSYPEAFQYFFNHASSYLMVSCPDPKNLGDNLDNGISWDTKEKVMKAFSNAAKHASHAIVAESENNPETAIYWWRKIFGTEFPPYG
jgi:hypothetical protein